MKKLVRIDFDDIGDKIDYYLFNEDFEKAQEVSNVIKATIRDSLLYIRDNFEYVEILLIGADDILFSCTGINLEKLEALKKFYKDKSNLTVSIGFGNNIREVMLNLKEAKVSGKDIIKGL
jgi:hypothetical protein